MVLNGPPNTMDDILPTVDYPSTIRGSLRLILQLKDAFLGSFNLVEEYRDQLLACKHGFTRELVVYQLVKGLKGIRNLRQDLEQVEAQARRREKRNKLLRQYLVQRYDSLAGAQPLGVMNRMDVNGQLDIGSAIPPPIAAPDSVEQALHGGLTAYARDVNIDDLEVPEEMDLATSLTTSGSHLMPVVEFYRALYFLQMHFQIIMCQAANYALPVVTQPLSVSERTFAWPTAPSYGFANRTGGIRDRLIDIHTEVMSLASRLHECLQLVQAKMRQDQRIESYFTQHTAAQENARRGLLRAIQSQRNYIEALEVQNDRLTGLAIKLDPSFARSADFPIMTGPGLNIPDDDFATNQNSAIPGAPVSLRGPDHNGSRDRDSRNGRRGGYGPQSGGSRGRSGYNHSQERYRENGHTGSNQRRQFDQKRDERYPDDVDGTGYYVHDTNISGTAAGRPAVCVPHTKLSHINPDTNGKSNPAYENETETDLTRKLTQLRGHSQTVEELLIGVDSVASGMGKLVTDVEQMITPSFMNTDQYVTSMYDEVYGQIPNQRSSRKSVSSTWKKRMVAGQQHHPDVRTSSTKPSHAGTISPDLSTKNSITTVSESPDQEAIKRWEMMNTVAGQIRNDSVKIQNRSNEESDMREVTSSHECDTVDNTTSEELQTSQPLDTNVNASHVGLPKLASNSRHPLSRLTRTAKSSPPTVRVRADKQPTDDAECPPSEKPADKYNQGLLNTANEIHLRQVPTVGTAECGFMCMPEWISHRAAAKAHKPEDLLEEPKRSAFTKAVLAHRCRLVETILQADEDRLEEIINMILKQ